MAKYNVPFVKTELEQLRLMIEEIMLIAERIDNQVKSNEYSPFIRSVADVRDKSMALSISVDFSLWLLDREIKKEQQEDEEPKV